MPFRLVFHPGKGHVRLGREKGSQKPGHPPVGRRALPDHCPSELPGSFAENPTLLFLPQAKGFPEIFTNPGRVWRRSLDQRAEPNSHAAAAPWFSHLTDPGFSGLSGPISVERYPRHPGGYRCRKKGRLPVYDKLRGMAGHGHLLPCDTPTYLPRLGAGPIYCPAPSADLSCKHRNRHPAFHQL